MSRIARFAVLATALMSLLGIGAALAGAVTWDNHGDTHFLATGGAGTLSSTSVGLVCNNSDATGRTTTPIAGAIAPVADITILFTNCSLSGQSVGVECGVTLTAKAAITGGITGDADATCGVYLAGIKTCHIEGSVHGQYTNPIPSTTFGVLTTTTGGSFRTTNGAANCPLGVNDVAHLSILQFVVTHGTGGPAPHLGPSITQTLP